MTPHIAEIQKAVAQHFGVPFRWLVEADPRAGGEAGSRRPEYVVPRQVAMYLCRTMTAHSSGAIGRHFGGRDHTTVLNAFGVIANRAEADRKIAASIAEITAALHR